MAFFVQQSDPSLRRISHGRGTPSRSAAAVNMSLGHLISNIPVKALSLQTDIIQNVPRFDHRDRWKQEHCHSHYGTQFTRFRFR